MSRKYAIKKITSAGTVFFAGFNGFGRPLRWSGDMPCLMNWDELQTAVKDIRENFARPKAPMFDPLIEIFDHKEASCPFSVFQNLESEPY